LFFFPSSSLFFFLFVSDVQHPDWWDRGQSVGQVDQEKAVEISSCLTSANSVSGGYLRSISIPGSARTLCLGVVVVKAHPRLLVGSDGLVFSFDTSGKTPAVFLTCPEEGEVLCLASTGLNAFCAGLRRKGQDSGLVCHWSFN
jgi:hypothetical protein